MANTLQLELVTPEKTVVDKAVDSVQIPGADGYMGILPGHAALLSELGTGALERGRVDVGEVVGDDLDVGLLGRHAGGGNGKRTH